MRLSELKTGQTAYIVKVNGRGSFRKRILEMGFVRGQEVKSILNAPLKDPIKYGIMDYEVSLRRSEAVLIEISMLKEGAEYNRNYNDDAFVNSDGEKIVAETEKDTETANLAPNGNGEAQKSENPDSKIIRVALVGNPNAGKTSIFNLASGAHEHVGNYSGVTVDSKEGTLKRKGYTFKLTDLPGTYSLSAYSPEELYVRKYIFNEKPDVVINVVSASALERNLYLTTELIDLEVPMVIALNMYDELQESGRKFDYEGLGKMIDTPIVATVGKKGWGIPELLDEVIRIHAFEEKEREEARHRDIPYGRVLENAIGKLGREFTDTDISALDMPLRYLCIKLLESDKDVVASVKTLPGQELIFFRCEKERKYIESLLREDPETAFTNARYGFIAGGLQETLTEKTNPADKTRIIDSIVTNKYVGFPLFFLFLWIMFETTFRLGSYPMAWIEGVVAFFGDFVRSYVADGPLKDLLVDGIIGGVGGVIVFLPNIVILYAFIAFMEDSGYMARAAFIMDRIMHGMGLHGKSFIPLIMGFGCNVPAVMSTRTVESRSSRMITMLILPFMSCSARLPVYILFIGAFFSRYASVVLLGLYVTGIFLAVISARIFRKYLFPKEDTPFVMELPPYRMPTLKSVLTHMWERSQQYLKKMGGVILLASIVVWFLGYFPRNGQSDAASDRQIAEAEALLGQNKITVAERDSLVVGIANLRHIEQQQNSYIGVIGQFVEPVMRPLGFDWKISVSLVSGMLAKEIVVSSMGVLYTGDSDNQRSLQNRLKAEVWADGSPVFVPLVAIGFLLFVLIYFPCIATIAAIKEEAHSWKWAIFSVLYSTCLAWVVALLVYQIGSLF
ncbi:MAG: ferrous iron transport protein B [Dysgonamonadaceae bacterium]|jgi:ferrous iron transport protein B|nr:ferrous iron transport protein B [Dysgonamonadaceae bacterium]